MTKIFKRFASKEKFLRDHCSCKFFFKFRKCSVNAIHTFVYNMHIYICLCEMLGGKENKGLREYDNLLILPSNA